MPTVFIWEYASAVTADAVPPSIRTEGWAMLSAVLEDFARLENVRVRTLLHAQAVARCQTARLAVEIVSSTDREPEQFAELAADADWTLVIAPESEGLLTERCRQVLRSGGRLLGPTPDAIELTADKSRLAEHLIRHHVPTPRCHRLSEVRRDLESPSPLSAGERGWGEGVGLSAQSNPLTPTPLRQSGGEGLSRQLRSEIVFPAVLKPRDGAGSQATFRIDAAAMLSSCVAQARAEGFDGELVLQSYVSGRAASVAFLVGGPAPLALLPATQELSDDGRFHYRGGVIPLRGSDAVRVLDLGRRAVVSVPGLMGYVGVDLVLGATAAQDVVIEINPRLTTSYVGLRALATFNLAAALLEVAAGRTPREVGWREGTARFAPAGTVEWRKSEDVNWRSGR